MARDAGRNARAGSPGEAAREADALLFAVDWSRTADNTGLVVAHTSSGAEALAKMIPQARVVCAFNTVPSEVLFGVYEARRKAGRPSLVYRCDDKGGKAVAAELIGDAGFDPVDAGPLHVARYTEPFALLVAQLAYEGKGGPDLAYRFERLEQ